MPHTVHNPNSKATARHTPQLKRPQNGGFALVIALSLMAFVLLLLLSITTLVQVETRSAQTQKEKLQAQQNARMALMLALGEMQKAVGPDQRVTANASIFANDATGNRPDAPAFDPSTVDTSYETPHLLGVWDSWTTWLSGDSDASEIAATYSRGRSSKFRRFLVSHPDAQSLSTTQWQALAQSYGSLETVPLIQKVLGANPAANDTVQAPIVKVATGGYAWHVSGNNQKTNVTLGRNARGTEPSDSAAELANLSTHGLNASIDPILTTYPLENSSIEKVSSLQTSALVAPSATTFLKDHLNQNYHAYTAHSDSVLADVRKGGLKKDLNLLLEQPQLPTDYYGLAGNPDNDAPVTIRKTGALGGYLGTPTDFLPATGAPNLPSWYKLHQYYQLYKGNAASLDEPAAFSQGTTYRKGVQYQNKQPSTSFTFDDSDMFQRGNTRVPIIARYMMQLGARENLMPGDIREFLITVNPVLTLWNPYNTPLEVPKTKTEIGGGNALEYRLTQGDTEIKGWSVIDLKYHVSTSHQTGLDTGQSITLAPGEARLFSANVGENDPRLWDHHALISPGYSADYMGNVKRIALDSDLTGYTPGEPVYLHLRFTGTEVHGKETYNFYWAMWNDGNPTQRFSQMGVRTLPKSSTLPASSGDTVIPLTEPGGKQFTQVDNDPFNPTTDHFLNFGFALKGGDFLNIPDFINPESGKDYRSKSFVLSNPSSPRFQFCQATDRIKGIAQYEFFHQRGSGGALAAPRESGTNRGYIFSSYGTSGQTLAPLVELPLAPAYSLASLQTHRLSPGTGIENIPGAPGGGGIHGFVSGANVGLGIGNAYANPLIPQDDIYGAATDVAADLSDFPSAFYQRRIGSNLFDLIYIHNDALYDEWFCSSLTDQSGATFSTNRALSRVFDESVTNTSSLPNQQLLFDLKGTDPAEVKTELLSSDAPQPNAFKKVAKYLTVKGGFNVNSTSVEAWKGLFHGLRTESFQYLDPDSNRVSTHSLNSPQVVISRFGLPNSADEAPGSNAATDSASWLGVRYLTDPQIDKLAKECVRQVKLRGPFLNLSDFINRRLDPNDTETSLVGALQAALDWDEFNGNTPSNGATSINGRFKGAGDMIRASDISAWDAGPSLTFEEAYFGSRWTGIPGYVMQGDLLKRIGNQITVRDDTFTIRAYGDKRDLRGKIISTAVCEAVITRSSHYIENNNDIPETSQASLTSAINQGFGRKMKIISFRWLSEDEI